MTGLSREDRRRLARLLRNDAKGQSVPKARLLREWADKLEAEDLPLDPVANEHLSVPEPVSVEPVATLYRCPCGLRSLAEIGNHHDARQRAALGFVACPDQDKVEEIPVSPTADLEALQTERENLENVVVGAHLRLDSENVANGDLEDRIATILRERDEAREALRELLAAMVQLEEGRAIFRDPNGSSEPFNAAVPRIEAAITVAKTITEGVERTHVLVPRTRLWAAAELAQDKANYIARRYSAREAHNAAALAEAFRAAARGDRQVVWPS
jgi:hypothetical protein